MLEPGEIIDGRFEVEGLLGEGGLAQVFRVRHTGLGSLHALKLLTWRKKALAERLIVEGKIQAQLNHPNIVAVTDLVRHNGQLGLLMEYVDHNSLEEYLQEQGGLGLEPALRLFAPVLSAVTAAHDAGVTHRDLKPANILLSSSARGLTPKVTDFGIAKVVQDLASGSTAIGSTMGSPGYLAPEQIQDSSTIDARADIFALGAICWELITGVRAFADDDGKLTVASTLQNTPREASAYGSDVPPHVDAALAKAMEKSPDDRFDDCRSFARALFRDQPEWIALVEGQVPTGVLSLENVRETLEKSLAGSMSGRSGAVHSQPTLVSLPEVVEEDAAAVVVVPSSRWPQVVLILAGVGVLALLGVASMAGGMTAWWANDLYPEGGEAGTEARPHDSLEPAVVVPEPAIAAGPAPDSPGPEPIAGTLPEPPAQPAPSAPVPQVSPSPTPTPVPSAATVPPEVEAPPEPEVLPEPELPPEVAVQPEPAVAPTAPQPVAAPIAPDPVPVAPDVSGSWSGRANRRPFQLQLSAVAGEVTGRAIFPGPSTREESLRGTITPDGAVEFNAADLVFVGKVDGPSMQGTYRRSGGKALNWSVQSR